MANHVEGGGLLFVFLLPDALLIRQPGRKVLCHWKWVLAVSGHPCNLWLLPLLDQKVLNSFWCLSWRWLNMFIIFLLAHTFDKSVWQDTLLPVKPKVVGFFLQPLGQFDLFDGVCEVLEDGRNADHFLNLGAKSVKVVTPVQDILDVDLCLEQILVFCPFCQVILLDLWVRVKDLSGNCALSNWLVSGKWRYYEIACQSCFPLNNFRA